MMRKFWLPSLAVALVLPAALAGACGSSSDVESGAGNSGTGNSGTGNSGVGGGGGGLWTGGGGTGASSTGLSGGTGGCSIGLCGGKMYECGDCIDNDGDGLTDSQDPECLGPCHNSESMLDSNIPGGNVSPCRMDCFWDSNTGWGDDGCAWDHRCDPLEPQLVPNGCSYDPNGGSNCVTEQTQGCLDFCGPLTPNGCDCFGCCELPGGSGNWVYLNSETSNNTPSCNWGVENDPIMCHPCTPQQGCFNSCEHCEICLGKPELPEDCYGSPDGGPGWDGGWTPDGGPTPQCPGGEQPCGLSGQLPCPFDAYCITGCCIPIPA
jgi:hypothetical protein